MQSHRSLVNDNYCAKSERVRTAAKLVRYQLVSFYSNIEVSSQFVAIQVPGKLNIS